MSVYYGARRTFRGYPSYMFEEVPERPSFREVWARVSVRGTVLAVLWAGRLEYTTA